MSKSGYVSLPRLLVGVALGAAAIALYSRRVSYQRISAPGTGELPSGDRIVTFTGGSAVQNTTTHARAVGQTVQQRANSLIAQVQSYVQSARRQLDVAIAEGQAEAARTRQELETRFAAAQKNPDSARSAFM